MAATKTGAMKTSKEGVPIGPTGRPYQGFPTPPKLDSHGPARIISLCMEPQLISIAGVYRTSEIPLPADVLSKPTQVRLVGGAEGKLVMDPLNPPQRN